MKLINVSFVVLLGRVGASAFAFITTIVAGMVFSVEEFGSYSFFLTVSTFVTFVVFDPWFQRYITKEKYENLVSLDYYIVFVVLTALFLAILAYIFDYYLAALGIVFGLAFGITNVLTDLQRLLSRFILFFLFSWARPVLILLAVLVLYGLSERDFDGYLLTLLVVCWSILVIRLSGVRFSLRNLKLNSEFTKFVGWLLVAALFNYLIATLDKFVLYYNFDERVFGLYSYSYDLIFKLFSPVSSAFFVITFPLLVKRFSEKDSGGITLKKFIMINSFFLFSLSFAVFFTMIFVYKINPDFFLPYHVVAVLVLSSLFNSYKFLVFDSAFKIYDKTSYIFLVIVIVFVIKIPLTFVLIEKFEIAGAAYSSLLAYGCGVIFSVVYFLRLRHAPKN